MQRSEDIIVDFRHGGDAWPSIDDVVMGGVSNSRMVIEDGMATFRGLVSLENNGGFASLRSRPARYDLSRYDGLVLRIRGDGKRYGFRLRTTTGFGGVSYQVKFDTTAGEWRDLELPFDRFEPVFRGRRVADHPPLDPSEIATLGLIISDAQAGPFRLDLQWIGAYMNQE